MLRDHPATQFVFARLAALLRGGRRSTVPAVSGFVEVSVTGKVDQHAAILDGPDAVAAAAPTPTEPRDREQLIHRRWAETGIKMWNPGFHGTGVAALNIQGSAELLAAKPGESLPAYDKLEFRLIDGRILCAGVPVAAPGNRRPA